MIYNIGYDKSNFGGVVEVVEVRLCKIEGWIGGEEVEIVNVDKIFKKFSCEGR